MRGMFSTLAIIWRLASPYFRSEDKWAGRVLLAAVIAIELSIVGINVLLNSWNNSFYNALQDKDWNAIRLSAWLFLCPGYGVHTSCGLSALSKPMASDSLAALVDANLPRSLARRAPTITACNCLATPPTTPTSVSPKTSSNSSSWTLNIGLQLLNSCVTLLLLLGHPVGVVGGRAAALVWSNQLDIPGYLLWAALIYACIGTALTHLIGRALIALNFQQQRYEADFRFNLVRVRENSEQIALLNGERAERDRLLVALR